MSSADALLDGPRALGIGIEQGRVIIGLDEKRLGTTQPVANEIGDEADIAEHAEPGVRVANDEAHGINGIMRHREALDAHVLELEGGAALQEPPARLGLSERRLHERFLSERSAEQRNFVFAAEHFQTLRMIAVFMSKEDAVEVFRFQSDHLQPQHDLAPAQPSIHQQARAPRAHHRAVAGAAAAENSERKHFTNYKATASRQRATAK